MLRLVHTEPDLEEGDSTYSDRETIPAGQGGPRQLRREEQGAKLNRAEESAGTLRFLSSRLRDVSCADKKVVALCAQRYRTDAKANRR